MKLKTTLALAALALTRIGRFSVSARYITGVIGVLAVVAAGCGGSSVIVRREQNRRPVFSQRTDQRAAAEAVDAIAGDVLISLQRVSLGFLASLVVALPLGLLAGTFKPAALAADSALARSSG